MNVNLNKRYSQVTFPMAHDSHTCSIGKSYSDSDDVPLAVDQTVAVDVQLAMGIRAVRVSTRIDYTQSEKGHGLVLMHGASPQHFNNFYDYLEKVCNFLVLNPNEIVTIIDEGSVDFTSQHEFRNLLAEAYGCFFPTKDVAGNNLSIYTPDDATLAQLPNDPTAWPTLQTLISTGQRLLVFQSSVGGHNWMLPAYDDIKTPCIATSDAGNPLATPHIRPGFPGMMVDPKRADGSLYLINHYFYHHVMSIFNKAVNESARNLNKWVVGDLLIENTLRACAVLKRRPNFINVDFFQGVFGTYSYLMTLVDALNAVDDTLGVGSTAWLETVTDAITKQPVYVDDTDCLSIGTSYVIRPAADPTLSLAVSGQLVTLEKTDTQTQFWQIFYNTPQQGLTLVCAGQQIVMTADMQMAVQDYIPMNGGTGFELRRTDKDSAWAIHVSNTTDCGLFSNGSSVLCCGGQNQSINAQWLFIPATQPPVTGTPAFINRTQGTLAGNFEVMVPAAHGHGYLQYTRDNNRADGNHPWLLANSNLSTYGDNSFDGFALVETSTDLKTIAALSSFYSCFYCNNPQNGWNLQIQMAGNRMFGFLGASNPGSAPTWISSGKTPGSTPALILNSQNQLELLIPQNSGGFINYRRSDTSGTSVGSNWDQVGGTIGSGQKMDSISLLQNKTDPNSQNIGNLEAMALVGGQLVHFYRINDQWSAGETVSSSSGLTGAFGFTQRSKGIFVVAAPLASGGFVVYERSGSDNGFAWTQVGTFNIAQKFDAISLIVSQKYGNVEMVARSGNQLVHGFTTDNKSWSIDAPFSLSQSK